MSLLARVQCKESLVWFEASGFCYTVMLGPNWDSSWIPCCFFVSWRSCSFRSTGQVLHKLQKITNRVDIGVGQPITWFWACIVARLIILQALSPSAPPHPDPHYQGELSSSWTTLSGLSCTPRRRLALSLEFSEQR